MCLAEHIGLAELAIESLLAKHVHAVVFPALALNFIQEDAALHQLFCELAAGEHNVLLRSSSMELQAAVRMVITMLLSCRLGQRSYHYACPFYLVGCARSGRGMFVGRLRNGDQQKKAPRFLKMYSCCVGSLYSSML